MNCRGWCKHVVPIPLTFDLAPYASRLATSYPLSFILWHLPLSLLALRYALCVFYLSLFPSTLRLTPRALRDFILLDPCSFILVPFTFLFNLLHLISTRRSILQGVRKPISIRNFYLALKCRGGVVPFSPWPGPWYVSHVHVPTPLLHSRVRSSV